MATLDSKEDPLEHHPKILEILEQHPQLNRDLIRMALEAGAKPETVEYKNDAAIAAVEGDGKKHLCYGTIMIPEDVVVNSDEELDELVRDAEEVRGFLNHMGHKD